DASGHASLRARTSAFALDGARTLFDSDGSSIIVHNGSDAGGSDGGTRVACGAIHSGDANPPGALTMWSQGTLSWPDEACNPDFSFGGCNTNNQDHADAWATF